MESERLNIFDDQGQPIGTATRHDVHQQGLWHETFHCWFISHENSRTHLYFQIRSKDKLDYPDLLDITVAGHLLAEETVKDGVRELKEEVGIDVSFDQLIPIGKVSYTMLNGRKIDNEIANVFVHVFKGVMEDFILQAEEVSGIVKIDLEHFSSFLIGELSEIEAEGFELIDGKHIPLRKLFSKHDFVEHGEFYFDVILPQIKQVI